MNTRKTAVETLLAQVSKMYTVGQKLISNIEKLLQSEQAKKISPEDLDAMQVNKRALRRRYQLKEAAAMVGVSHPTIYQAEEDGRLPKPDIRNNTARQIRAGYTIAQVNEMRRVFGTLPRRPADKMPPVVGFLNLKGGAWKTTLTWLFGQYLAIRGYRILMVDTDPQGSLSFNMGYRPDIDVSYEDTFAPFMLQDSQALMEAGHGPEAYKTLHYAIKQTYWPNIDIIPSCLQTLAVDLEMPILIRENQLAARKLGKESSNSHIEALREGLKGVADDYDFILLDGTPSLNISTMNVVSACDVTIVPTPAAMADFASTLQFTSLIKETMEAYMQREYFPPVPEFLFCITKFSESPYSEWMSGIIRKTFEVNVLQHEAHQSDELGKSTNKITSIYEVNPSESNNRQRLKNTIERFDGLFQEIHDHLWQKCFNEVAEEAVKEPSQYQSMSDLLKQEGVL